VSSTSPYQHPFVTSSSVTIGVPDLDHLTRDTTRGEEDLVSAFGVWTQSTIQLHRSSRWLLLKVAQKFSQSSECDFGDYIHYLTGIWSPEALVSPGLVMDDARLIFTPRRRQMRRGHRRAYATKQGPGSNFIACPPPQHPNSGCRSGPYSSPHTTTDHNSRNFAESPYASAATKIRQWSVALVLSFYLALGNSVKCSV
jgi:hypothetical protein